MKIIKILKNFTKNILNSPGAPGPTIWNLNEFIDLF
jgi:hypothetical protein